MEVKVMEYRFQCEGYKILSPSDKLQEDILKIIQEEQQKSGSNDLLSAPIIYEVGKKVIKANSEEYDLNNYTLEQVEDFCTKPYNYPQMGMEEMIQELSCTIMDVVLNYYRGMQLQLKLQELELVKASVTASLDVLEKKSKQVEEEIAVKEELIKAIEGDKKKTSILNKGLNRKQKRASKRSKK